MVIVAATPKHAEELALTMRADDLAECIAAGYPDARSALDEAVAKSVESLAVTFDGEVGALVGVSPLENGITLVWALTGRAVDGAKLSFFRASRTVLQYFQGKYAVLANRVDVRYQGALDWLECLGFSFGPIVHDCQTGMPFQLVTIRGVN